MTPGNISGLFLHGSLLRFLAIDFFLFVIYFAAMASLVVVAGVSTAVESV